MDAPKRTVLLAGATGLVGGFALQHLLDSAGWRLIAPTRRPIPGLKPPHQNPQLDTGAASTEGEVLEALRVPAKGEVCAYLCALGTTIKSAGSPAAFAAVDRELVLKLARVARALGARHAVVVSSVGADASAGNFYLRTKGQMEAELANLGFDRVDCLRPALLIGDRSERRVGEEIAQAVNPWINPLLLGPLRRYRSMEAKTVAAAAVGALDERANGIFVHEHTSLMRLAGHTLSPGRPDSRRP